MDILKSVNPTPEEFRCENTVVKHKCKYCDFMTDLRIILNNHVWWLHKTSYGYYSMIDLQIKPYSCNNCEFMSYSLLIWMSHQRHCVYVSDEENTCIECSCGSEGSRRHVTACCTYPKEIRPFTCDQCEYKAKKKGTLTQHINLKHPPKHFTYHECSHCPYKTALKHHLRRHIIARHTESEQIKWFQCDRCEYKAKQRCHLKQHINLRHTRENLVNYECSLCPFKAVMKCHLKTHMIVRHTEPEKIKWFRCDQCGYKAKQKTYLKRHIERKHAVKIWIISEDISFYFTESLEN